ncbi:hypothetical protein BDB01DRAFT_619388 [Pilobolus umbonatus]|nr:hypothetical protein BDB01DRAFT_619388 [Pilobolus umbonatus]
MSDCFEVEYHKNQFNRQELKITNKFIQMIKFDKKSVSPNTKKSVPQKSKKSNKKKKISGKIESSSLNKMNVIDLSTKIQLSLLRNYYTPEEALIPKYKEKVPADKHLKMLSLYIDSLQVYIKQYFIAKGIISMKDKLEIYFTVDSVLYTIFNTDYEDVRSIFLTIMDEPFPAQPIKLLHTGQITGVYCKDVLLCYQQVDKYLDYPQHIVQVHLYSTHIDFTVNAIVALTENIKSTANETVLTIKLKNVQFDTLDIIAELLWNHTISADKHTINCCSKHKVSDYEDCIDMYYRFIKQFKVYMTKHFSIMNNEKTADWYKSISIPLLDKCCCTYSTTLIDLYDVCIKPAVHHLASTICSVIKNTDMLEEYKINHTVIMGTPIQVKSTEFNKLIFDKLKEIMENTTNYLTGKPIHWFQNTVSNIVDKGMMSIINNPLGGILEEVSPSLYYFRFDMRSQVFFKKMRTIEPLRSSHAHVDERQRIDLNVRDSGYTRVYTFEDPCVEIFLYHKANDQHYTKGKCIHRLDYVGADTYPIACRSVNSLGKITFSFHYKNERKSPLLEYKSPDISINEIILLSPFV